MSIPCWERLASCNASIASCIRNDADKLRGKTFLILLKFIYGWIGILGSEPKWKFDFRSQNKDASRVKLI